MADGQATSQNNIYRGSSGSAEHGLFGRKVLTTPYNRITAANVVGVLESVRADMDANAIQTQTLYDYYRGKQAILGRTKKVRPEICNRAVVNCALEIVSFKTGYIFGEPIQYICRASGAENDNSVSERVAILNELMYRANKAALDKELAEWMFICGSGYRMLLAGDTEQPFRLDTLDPRRTAIVYTSDFGRAPVMSIQKRTEPDGDTSYWCYTPDSLYKIRGSILESQDPNWLGFIPVFEYTTNTARLGAFEPVIDLIDALNTAINNRLDGVEQFVQSIMKCVNVKLDREKYAELREEGLIQFTSDPGNPGDVDIVASELNQTQTQVLVDDIYKQILIKCDMPDRDGAAHTTGDTGQAVILRNGFTAAESYARSIVMSFEPAEKRFLTCLLRMLANDGNDLGIKTPDIGIKFTRNMTDNLLTKTQGLQNMLEAGVHPRIAFANCNLFSDPEQVYIDSMEYLEKWRPGAEQPEEQGTPANNKPNPDDTADGDLA